MPDKIAVANITPASPLCSFLVIQPFIFFKLKDNSFTEFCCFLSNLNMNQPSVQFSSVAQSCPTLCDPMNHSTPGLPVHHQLPEFTQITSIKSVMPSSHLILCSRLLLLPPNPSQHQSLFQ